MGHKIFILPQNERFIVLGVILLLWLIIRGSQFLASRGQARLPLGAPRSYGIGGGAICPKCQRPFAIGFLAINMGIGSKLVCCPFCGKWSVVRLRGMNALREAEAAELASSEQSAVGAKSEEEKLREMVDHSRYTEK